jgi:hypothetical protein
MMHPFSDPVISWKAFWGFRIAEVMMFEVSSVPTESDAAERVETTSPVATEYILTDEPRTEKK